MQTPTPSRTTYAGLAVQAAGLAEQVFAHKEALRELVHLDAIENAGLAGPGHAAKWRKAVARAIDLLNEEGGQ